MYYSVDILCIRTSVFRLNLSFVVHVVCIILYGYYACLICIVINDIVNYNNSYTCVHIGIMACMAERCILCGCIICYYVQLVSICMG